MKFSSTEKKDLLKAWLAISVAFAILTTHGFTISGFLTNFVLSAFTVGIAFLLHELGHKYLAQKYRCWAEFRAFDFMLFLAIAMSFFGFIFAAPGAVMIKGNITTSKNGKISAMGPLVNLALAVVFLGLFYLGLFTKLTFFGFYINSFIALFNMLPFWEFDGAKIFAWNKAIYAGMVAAGLLFVAFAYSGF